MGNIKLSDIIDGKIALQDIFLEGSSIQVNDKNYFIQNGVLKVFKENNNYTDSFSLQWTKFRNLQQDSINNNNHSEERFLKNAKWSLEEMKNSVVLECGSGPGRFTEILSKYFKLVISIDMSDAIYVNRENNLHRDNILYIHGDLRDFSEIAGKIDYLFCYGVLQHTPDPAKTFLSLFSYLKTGGKLTIDSYRKYNFPMWCNTPKYLWRPITKNLNHQLLLSFIEFYIPFYLPIDTFIKKLPYGNVIAGLIPIPCWNYMDKGFSKEERVQHAIMDTFDALSPEHDYPIFVSDARNWITKFNIPANNIDIFYGSNGVVINCTRSE